MPDGQWGVSTNVTAHSGSVSDWIRAGRKGSYSDWKKRSQPTQNLDWILPYLESTLGIKIAPENLTPELINYLMSLITPIEQAKALSQQGKPWQLPFILAAGGGTLEKMQTLSPEKRAILSQVMPLIEKAKAPAQPSATWAIPGLEAQLGTQIIGGENITPEQAVYLQSQVEGVQKARAASWGQQVTQYNAELAKWQAEKQIAESEQTRQQSMNMANQMQTFLQNLYARESHPGGPAIGTAATRLAATWQPTPTPVTLPKVFTEGEGYFYAPGETGGTPASAPPVGFSAEGQRAAALYSMQLDRLNAQIGELRGGFEQAREQILQTTSPRDWVIRERARLAENPYAQLQPTSFAGGVASETSGGPSWQLPSNYAATMPLSKQIENMMNPVGGEGMYGMAVPSGIQKFLGNKNPYGTQQQVQGVIPGWNPPFAQGRPNPWEFQQYPAGTFGTPVETPSAQGWASAPWSVQQQLLGYLESLGQQPSELLASMQKMQPNEPSRGTSWRPRLQYA